MKFAGILDNDIADGMKGLSVSFWVQGCPFHCKGCHNSETWDYNRWIDWPERYKEIVYDKLIANGITRNLSILGGEPLCSENIMPYKNLWN